MTKMDFYPTNFAALALINVLLAYREYKQEVVIEPEKGAREKVLKNDFQDLLKAFKWRFLPIYLLVNGSDWLQVSKNTRVSFGFHQRQNLRLKYLETETNIYTDEKGLAEEVVAALFMTGFLSGAVSASFTGKLADRYGRRAACLAFCVIYSLSCLTLLTNDLATLFLGRVLGGVSTTLMYSVFESWMVTEFNASFPDAPGSILSGIFSTMTTLNTVVAILAGIFAEWVTDLTGTEKAPFMTAAGCLMVAFFAISKNWVRFDEILAREGENYGESGPSKMSMLDMEGKGIEAPAKSTLRLFLDDKRLLALGVTSCFFEGSMYIFIFFKFPALKLSHKLAGHQDDLPFGVIFAVLMCSMMTGSMIYNYTTTSHASITPTKLLIATLSVAAASFFLPVLIRDESVTFWCFCVFEVCCGVYFPLMAYQKGRIVDDSVRANVYGLMRVPLNCFVVLVLSTTREGMWLGCLLGVIANG
ncbi:Molybdate-anion transporter [Lachnellula arida]|uniref:Molybdate-anion transporter n=1 Tax=Lachnellula arida TaxID=1316785 RepID=A0A8T9BK16_9HELO|nr:Molybdate-anion transporter [Lachnellula arida]